MEKKSATEKGTGAPAAPARFSFDVAVKRDPAGDPLHHESVKQSDLLGFHEEVWLEQLRRGQPWLALEDMLLRTLPAGRRPDRPICEGLLVEATGPSGETVSRRFGLDALAHVALRGAAQLLETGELRQDQNYYYELVARREETFHPGPAEPSPEVGGSFTVRRAPLACLEHPLPALLEQADAVGPVRGWSPVFYSHDVFLRANNCSRSGAAKQPPEESGAVLLGLPCSCPETGEFYLVVTDIIPLEETEQSTYTLSFSGKTWGRIQAAVRVLQARPGRRFLRLIGQCHGHNFYPCMLEGTDCRGCEKRETCTLTSVFVSDQDQLWARAVFAGQPWAFTHIFGLDSRGVKMHGQFAFQAGRMVQRGFYLLPEIPASLTMSGAAAGTAGKEDLEDEGNGKG